MLVKPHKIFKDALANRFAVGAFNTSNLEITQAIIGAAAAKSSPVIVQTSEGAIEYAGLEVLAGIISTLAARVQVPVVMHLDHGKSLTMAQECIEAGYTSVMIDASNEKFDRNMALVKGVVEFAHGHGVWVEAELGAILGKEGARALDGRHTPDEFLTQPDEVGQFVAETHVDALAISVGTIHGAFTGQEYVRFELLDRIQQAAPDTVLVLHGASGIADAHLRQAAQTNVCKVNVDTEMRIAFEQALRAYLGEPHDLVDPRKALAPAREAVQRVVERKMEIFGSVGRATM